MKVIFHEQAWNDYLYWQQQDSKMLIRLNGLIKECIRAPFDGTAKPEPLKGQLSGWWPRRLNREHRLVYRIEEDQILIAQCRYHY